ncbi:MAG: DUF1614 domain-containing protein [Syntrophobacteraceae bacterium]
MFFPPFLMLFFFLFIFLLFFVFGLVQFGLITAAFSRLGLPPHQLFSLFFLCMVGSMINIPLWRIPLDHDPEEVQFVSYFGLRYRPPRWRHEREMVVAINIGGAIIPTLFSIYLFTHTGHPFSMLLALGIVTWIVHKVARPAPGMGIATPMLVPPIAAALAALLVSPAEGAPATAYVAGTLGTLIGADIMNLDKLKELHAPVASIGGAGTFDGIFLTGILAVLLA